LARTHVFVDGIINRTEVAEAARERDENSVSSNFAPEK
jgi:hypothetical protein